MVRKKIYVRTLHSQEFISRSSELCIMCATSREESFPNNPKTKYNYVTGKLVLSR